jgi:hypothetical protein
MGIGKSGPTRTFVFGYGSLIWNTGDVQPITSVEGYLAGWHRSWNWISKKRRHGAPTCNLVEGGRVKGVFIELDPGRVQVDLEEIRRRENRQTERTVLDRPVPSAVTHFWTMGENIDDFEDLRGLEALALADALARRIRGVEGNGPDGISAEEYLRRVHRFDQEDQITRALVNSLDRIAQLGEAAQGNGTT